MSKQLNLEINASIEGGPTIKSTTKRAVEAVEEIVFDLPSGGDEAVKIIKLGRPEAIDLLVIEVRGGGSETPAIVELKVGPLTLDVSGAHIIQGKAMIALLKLGDKGMTFTNKGDDEKPLTVRLLITRELKDAKEG